MSSLYHRLLDWPLFDRSYDEFDSWWKRFSQLVGTSDHPFEATAKTALELNRLAWVVASGYSGALLSMFPTDDPVPRSICVTEENGNTPGAIETHWDRESGRLNGTKTIVTLATEAEQFLVLASAGENADGWKELVILEVAADAEGVTVVPIDSLDFVPELPHGRVTFEDVRVEPSALLREQAWEEVVKPFRLVEDIYVLGATAAWLLQWSRLTGQARQTRRFLSVLVGARTLSDLSSKAMSSAVIYSGLHDLLQATLDMFDWSLVRDDVREMWERDRRVLEVARRARKIRIELADRQFNLSKAEQVEKWTWEEPRFEGEVVWTSDGWLMWKEWQPMPRGSGARKEHRISEFLREGAPSWAPDDIVEKVRARLEDET